MSLKTQLEPLIIVSNTEFKAQSLNSLNINAKQRYNDNKELSPLFIRTHNHQSPAKRSTDDWKPPLPNNVLMMLSHDEQYGHVRNNLSPMLENDVSNLLRQEEAREQQTKTGFWSFFPTSPSPTTENNNIEWRSIKVEAKLPKRVGKYFLVGHKVGNGSFGTIYAGKNVATNEDVAIKIEPLRIKNPQLLFESRLYRHLGMDGSANYHHSPISGPNSMPIIENERRTNSTTALNADSGHAFPIGFPKLHWYGVEDSYNVMIIDFLGPCIEDLFDFCRNRLSLKSVLMLADQILSRIEYLHSKCIIHRDIKPENFLMGRGSKGHHIYLVDFGLAKRFIDEKTNQHIKFRKNISLIGTARYTSTNSHLGFEQSRRDDLESIGYVLVYLLKGQLPWQGLRAKTKEQRHTLIGKKKISTSIKSLCQGLPSEFVQYFQHVRSLQFEDVPDYTYLRRIFIELFNKKNYVLDFEYDWMLLKKGIFLNQDYYYT
ncbi:casein kinase [Acrasis kona]|uniref:non-specific serine/threonine protein kinase n=1 Tax=Acrasis kona TaxID=1008807 RepID=A0AAW2Z8T6_9EUKA